MVFRAYSEKKPGMSPEPDRVLADLRNFLGIENLEEVRVLCRYDLEGITPRVFEMACGSVLSEPPVDTLWEETFPDPGPGWHTIAVESLPGQFDQRADSLAQCIAMMTAGERPLAKSAKVYLLKGDLSAEMLKRITKHLVNPVESRVADSAKPETLAYASPLPPMVETLEGFTCLDEAGLDELRDRLGLAMDEADLAFLQQYFRDEEQRDPTITEVRVVDTYWSDHCRHTTFGTHLDNIEIEDSKAREAFSRYMDARREVYGADENDHPITLMDVGTMGAKVLKKRGLLPELDESAEINACSIHVPAVVNGETQDWLLQFKNETHNHPTEIEPFGGAATCIGGCIRDPLSGRAYVHQAMRVTGCADPRAPLADTILGKLPQRYIAQTAAQGYSSYGNQIGLATGHVAEMYHPGYAAKHLETGAVIGAVRADRVVREEPVAGDVVLLLGGRTGRDGIGGATGSSKSHNVSSLMTMASEVQKGNAPEERKLQRLFRDPAVLSMIRRCNDFGAGGVAVAVGELADGLEIDLNAVRKKYEGLDGTEIAISESQERMAVVVSKEDVHRFIEAATRENLEAYPVATVTKEPRIRMKWRDQTILDLSRAFLNTNGASKWATALIKPVARQSVEAQPVPLADRVSSLRAASRRGLAERFDSTVGAGTLLMPFGGVYQRTPAQVMGALLPVGVDEKTSTGALMSWAADPDTMSEDPYVGAYNAVAVSLAKLTAAGADWHDAYLTFQEYFERLGEEPERWGQPLQALLGAFSAQLVFGRPAIGGKDSMSGTFMDLDVPPTLISFAVAPIEADRVLSPEFKGPNHPVYLFYSGEDDLKGDWDRFMECKEKGLVQAAWAVERTPDEAVINMTFGNRIGFAQNGDYAWQRACPGGIVAELREEISAAGMTLLGYTMEEPQIRLGDDLAPIDAVLAASEAVLADVYPLAAHVTDSEGCGVPHIRDFPLSRTHSAPTVARPRVAIPVFPGTNCEYDSARSCLDAGLHPQMFVVRNLCAEDLAQSTEELAALIHSAQILFLPGGFSSGDEPEGSAKFIVSLLKNPRVRDAVEDLVRSRDGLVLGICNGFQALIKSGLLPYGELRDLDSAAPTLTYNAIGRHQSMIVRTRIVSHLSPWFIEADPDAIYSVPVSHGEGRFVASCTMLEALGNSGQIATRYVDLEGNPSMDTAYNPNGSMWSVEGITSPDGRILGKMGHSERTGEYLYANVPGNYDMGLFRSAAAYFG